MLCKQKSALTRANFSPSLFLCLLLPIIWGAEMRILGLDKLVFLSYNTTPAEDKPLRWEIASLLSKAFDHMA